jgi:hypothetical protein
MSDLLIRNIQRVLGVGGVVWAIFLLPSTSFRWWIGANFVYGVLALISAGLLVRGHRLKGRAVATAGVILFAGVNGFVASMACATGGACTEIIAVIAAVVPMQVAIVIVNGRFKARQPVI